MAIKRYARSPIIGINTKYGTSRAVSLIRKAISEGTVQFTTSVITDGQRLDTIAGVVYGDSTLWWVIAAASNIGWGLQVPPGTILAIPNLSDISSLVG